MNPAGNIEDLIKSFYATKRSSIAASEEMDKRVLDDALQTLEKSNKASTANIETKIWRVTMKNKIIKFAAAAVVIIAAVFGLTTILDHGAAPAYAVEQTIKAMKKIRTVYMRGEFYKQGKFECWMKFAGDPDKPTHIWLGRTGNNLCKICSPEGVFGLNKRTKAVHFARRDERDKDWVIKFGSFFKDAVSKANETDSVEIYNEKDQKTGKEVIVVLIKTSNREQKFLVDPETKLPISFSTMREDAPMEMMRKTLAVKNLEWIRYNEQSPDGIFDMPADAKIVKAEVDCMVDPDSGLIADGMSRKEACLAIVKQTSQALIDVDITTLRKLALFFRLYTPEIWEKVKDAKAAGQWVDEFIVTGDPYQEGDLWYVPCELKTKEGKAEVNTPMIKFYDMEGHTYCYIIGSKEKGVVD
jgi:hypothetical protein